MSNAATAFMLSYFILFCRVGACLMILPGFSSQHLPARVRLLIAMAYTLALSPSMVSGLAKVVSDIDASVLLSLVAAEVGVGIVIGTCGRIFFLALEFIGSVISTFIGFTGTPGVPIEDAEPVSSLTSIITMTATVMIFLADLPFEVLRGLIASYRVIEVYPSSFDSGMALGQITAVSSKAFLLALQIGSPFFLYSIVVNLLFSLANKMMPTVPVYFVSVPFVMLGGLAIMALIGPEFITIFMDAFRQWLLSGAP